MKTIKIRRIDNVCMKLTEAIYISENECAPVKIKLFEGGEKNCKKENKAILLEPTLAEYYERMIHYNRNSGSCSSRGCADANEFEFPVDEDNPEFERLLNIVHALNGVRNSVRSGAYNASMGYHNDNTDFVLYSEKEWKSIENTVELLQSLGVTIDEFLSDFSFLNFCTVVSKDKYEVRLDGKIAKRDDEKLHSMPMSVQKKAQRVFEQMSFDPRHIGMGKPELLSGDLRGTCSIRLTQTDRIYYKIDDERKVVSISSLFGHK